MSKNNQINHDIAKLLYEMAELLEMNNVPFKPRAYEKAARSIESFGDSVVALYKKNGKDALKNIPGVGEGIADRIAEYLDTGSVWDYEKLKQKIPVNVAELTSVEGVGPKTIKILYQKLKIKNIHDLERAARSGQLRTIPHFGEKLEAKILQGIEFQKSFAGRLLLGETLPYARAILKQLKASGLVDQITVAGSMIRWQETVGDIDILATSKRPRELMDVFVKLPEVKAVIARGLTKSEARLKIGIDADLRVVPKESFGAAVQYFAGDKNHNVAIRIVAQKKGYKLNEYGLFRGQKKVAGEDEKEIYQKLGMDWIPYELRRNNGEIEEAQKKSLPKLISFVDIRGDLQTQTNWTDGEHSMEEMALEAARLSREYIAITDHTRALAMTGGADEKKLERQMKAIDELNTKLHKDGIRITVLKGAEVNILKGGRLDIRDETLEQLDVVGVAVHSLFHLPEKEQAERIIRAMENPHVDILFHPTGRVINRRPPYALDMDTIFKAAARTGTILEIDAHPWRLDLKDDHIRRAKEYGCKFVIDTDAHAKSELSYMEYGIGQARRGWLEKKDVLNTLPLKEFLKQLKN
ncbi:DNA polymerase III [Candidatus Giovannonibacteria bacterium RIFCSPHIGHO2_02_FULL_46_20]|uniref:DNA polymerase beta n=1 Tax=Candidatus Giovannonibacteria bacterium RIFCSPHIGHO2_02_FULL_46_20 TaxID=1798338 RepID=A0A1F5WFP1_9BACT|nr:MAG: DNA polymerase III [Candidatus Giovannonibacteria bacterium RIFCSPHIGHO2_02_FULL_46_20]